MPPKDWDNIRDGIAALLDRLIGSTGDTGGSQTAGTVMAKENAVLGMADIIYKVSCFQNVANLEQTTFSANFNLPYSYKTKPKTLLKNIVLERDLYLTSASLSVSNGNNGGHANAAFELALNGNMVLSANVGTSRAEMGSSAMISSGFMMTALAMPIR